MNHYPIVRVFDEDCEAGPGLLELDELVVGHNAAVSNASSLEPSPRPTLTRRAIQRT